MFVYVLRSQKDNKRYIGIATIVEDRVEQHNRGEVKSTRGRRPLELKYVEEAETRVQARAREKYFKTAAGRRYLNKLGT